MFSHWIRHDSKNFCKECALVYAEQRRANAIAAVLDKGPPQVLFVLENAQGRNPDRPKGQEVLHGPAFFLDRGICFIALARRSEMKDEEVALVHFGLIGWIISATLGHARKKRTEQEVQRRLASHALDLLPLLEEADEVLYYPRHSLDDLKTDSHGFTIWFGETRKRFLYGGGRKVWSEIKDISTAYSEAIRKQTDPVMHCQHVLPLAQKR